MGGAGRGEGVTTLIAHTLHPTSGSDDTLQQLCAFLDLGPAARRWSHLQRWRDSRGVAGDMDNAAENGWGAFGNGGQFAR
jgi:hypothetical protein